MASFSGMVIHINSYILILSAYCSSHVTFSTFKFLHIILSRRTNSNLRSHCVESKKYIDHGTAMNELPVLLFHCRFSLQEITWVQTKNSHWKVRSESQKSTIIRIWLRSSSLSTNCNFKCRNPPPLRGKKSSQRPFSTMDLVSIAAFPRYEYVHICCSTIHMYRIVSTNLFLISDSLQNLEE